jgi:hypothetical protein
VRVDVLEERRVLRLAERPIGHVAKQRDGVAAVVVVVAAIVTVGVDGAIGAGQGDRRAASDSQQEVEGTCHGRSPFESRL